MRQISFEVSDGNIENVYAEFFFLIRHTHPGMIRAITLYRHRIFSFLLLLHSQKDAVKSINRHVFDQVFTEYRHSLRILGIRSGRSFNVICYLCLC